MNDLLFGIIYVSLVLMLVICVYFAIFVPRKNIKLSAFYRRGNVTTKKGKKQYSPYSICRSMQKKYGWSEEKTKRCIEHLDKELS